MVQEMALKQLTREIMMMQASDWAVLIKNDTYKEYALFRLKKHYDNAVKIITSLTSHNIDIEFLKKLEKENGIFTLIDWRSFVTKSFL